MYRAPNAPVEAAKDTRQSLFTAPIASTTTANPPPIGLPSKPAVAVGNDEESKDTAAQGTKRPREEESDDEEAPMEEDEDVPMDASSDED